ncbi:STAS domain-containing protein [Deltaproteobacteria bacterium TL4]
MELNHIKTNDICVVNVIGNIALDGVIQAREYLKPIATDPSIRGLIINLKEVKTLDSKGVGMIVSILKTIRERDAVLAISNFQRKVFEVFQLLGLDKIIPTFDTEETAIAWMKNAF